MLRLVILVSLFPFSMLSGTAVLAPLPDFAMFRPDPAAQSARKHDVTCVCCCEAMKEAGVSHCNHPVACGLCSLRLRLLLNETNCIMCKQPMEPLIITKRCALRFESLFQQNVSDTPLQVDEETGILFDDQDFMYTMQRLRSFNCPVCAEPFPSQRQLQEHVKHAHEMNFCQLCIDHRKVFPQEQVRPAHAVCACPRSSPSCSHASLSLAAFCK